jgi:ATP-binding cassette, subfamily B, multidrug efflux pump
MKEHYTFYYFLKKYKKKFLIGVIWLIIVDSLQLIIPHLLGLITDDLKYFKTDIHKIIKYSLIIVIIAIGVAAFRYLWRYYIIGTSRLLEKELREDFFQKLLSLSNRYYNDHKTGDLMAHATNDINAVRMALGPGIVMLTDALFLTIVTMFILILTSDPILCILALFPLPILAIISSKFAHIIHRRFGKVQEAFSKISDQSQENFSGIRVVKAFVREESEINKFADINKNNFDKNMNLIRIWGLFSPMIQFFSALSFLIVLWYGGIKVIEGTISLGNFVAFNSYLAMLIWPMTAIGFVINVLQRGSASLDRLNIIFAEKPEIIDSPDILSIKKIQGRVDIKNLSFRYNKRTEYVLKNINISISPGKTVAIIGRTGAGKTTLINLLLRIYNISEGEILIDGNNINKIPLKTIREEIGYVPQDNFLFSTSISENIAFFKPASPFTDIENAAKTAQIYENIIEFPGGFNTLVGERGVTLSGGQKQRISIARALIKNPAILILDDSLSAVDTRTEENIMKKLKQKTGDMTTIIISHRISSIKDSDYIYVLEEGEIIEEGKHDLLLSNKKLYYNIYKKQQLEEKLANI